MLTEIALKEMFDELDLDKDGSVTENELVKSFEGMDEFVNGEMIREIFKSTDTDNNGKITFQEFVIAERKREVLKGFNDLDHDKNGYISRTEMLEAFSDQSYKEIIAIFKGADANCDEKISFKGTHLRYSFFESLSF